MADHLRMTAVTLDSLHDGDGNLMAEGPSIVLTGTWSAIQAALHLFGEPVTVRHAAPAEAANRPEEAPDVG